MIPARTSKWFRKWFTKHAAGRLASTFGAVRATGLGHARQALRQGPVLLVANHTSWWDPLVILWLTEGILGIESFAMMDAANLQRLPFFGLVGAFGVDLGDPRDGALAMRYAVKLLDRPGRAVIVFAQGRERPITVRPLGFQRGAAEIARVAKAPAIPLAIRYEFGGDERPSLFLAAGDLLAPQRDVNAARDAQERAVTALLETLDADIAASDLGRYETLLAPSPRALDRLAERALAFFTRPRG